MPFLVYWYGDVSCFSFVRGYRSYEAGCLLGLDTIPASVQKKLDEPEKFGPLNKLEATLLNGIAEMRDDATIPPAQRRYCSCTNIKPQTRKKLHSNGDDSVNNDDGSQTVPAKMLIRLNEKRSISRKASEAAKPIWEEKLKILLSEVKVRMESRRCDKEKVKTEEQSLKMAMKIRSILFAKESESGKTFDEQVEDIAVEFGQSVDRLRAYLMGNELNFLRQHDLRDITAQWEKWSRRHRCRIR